MTTARRITSVMICVALALVSSLGHAASPIVHVVSERLPRDGGVLKLARHRGVTTARTGDATVVVTQFEEICALPCGVPVDTSERPIFFIVRDGKAASYGFRLPAEGEITLSVRPRSRGLSIAAMATFLLYTISVPLFIAASPKVSIGQGPPTERQKFKRLRRAH